MNIKKALLSALSVFFCIFLCSCFSSRPQTVCVGQGFRCEISLECSGMDIVAEVAHHAPGLCTVSIVRPDSLKGLTAEWEGGEIRIDHLGMSMSLDPDKFPDAAFLPAVLDALDSLSLAGEINPEPDQTGDRCICRGYCRAGEYIAMLDNETGALYRLQIPDYGIDAGITKFEKSEDVD